MKPLRVVFMGTPEFAVPTLKALSDRKDLVEIVAVYTQPDRPGGRGQKQRPSPVKEMAQSLGLPLFQPENINKGEEPQRLESFNLDVIVIVAYAHFLGDRILKTPRYGCINIHSSLLPRHRGAAPIQYTILSGDSLAGVTTMKLVKEMDAGPIYLQDSISVTPNTTTAELYDVLSNKGAALLIKTLEELSAGTLKEIQQDTSLATYARLLTKEMGLADWSLSFEELSRRSRAFHPWPGFYFQTQWGVLKLFDLQRIPFWNEAHLPKPGQIEVQGTRFLIACSDCWVFPNRIQREGKSSVSNSEFAQSYSEKFKLGAP